PAGWVQLREEVHGVKVDVRYATGKNFTGAPLPGYHLPQAWLRETVATSLARAAQTVREQGFVLVVYDAYRPIRATEAMVDWARRTDQTHLVRDGYIASRSGHNHGHTIDLSLLTLAGDSVDMGSPFDHFGAESHHGALVSDQARHHRLVLKTAMESAGFRAYSKEWWHYRHPLSGTLPMDVPIGCPSKGKPSGGP
ncbi:MAG TPA: peptidase M15, partial [Deltaproteobacteria bacterium]|nr:peptidase M15 [Deltaproteobacteria bacterium]